MQTVKYNPFSPFKRSSFDGILDDVFGRSVSEFMGSEFVTSTPSINIIENDGGYCIEVAAPGFDKSDFHIDLVDNNLTIKGKKEVDEDGENQDKFTRREFSYNSFSRSFHISDDIDQNSIEAGYKDGVLTVALNKKEEAKPQPTKTIEIG